MVGSTMSDERVKAAVTKDFIAVLVDLDENGDLAKEHGVAQIPTIVWLSPDGEVIERTLETNDVEDFLADAEDVLYEIRGEDEDDGM